MVCGQCGSFWDLQSYNSQSFSQSTDYPDDYPQLRGHFSEDTGQNKVTTLNKWLKRAGLQTSDKTVCEVGFGAGYTLQRLQKISKNIYGIEAAQSNIEFAQNQLKVPGENLFLYSKRPSRLPSPVDLWIFQDSFEHLLEISDFMEWLKTNSAPGAQVFIVAPRADSFSQRFMGRFWIHKGADHVFHWSSQGLLDFMGAHGFEVERRFYPLKTINLKVVLLHLLTKLGASAEPMRRVVGQQKGGLNRLSFDFNFGEMGYLFRKSDVSRL